MSAPATLHLELQTPTGLWVDVGFLLKSDSKNWFEFSPSYWNLPDRPVLGQIFEEQGRLYRPSARVALPHWFSHLLPEGRLRQVVAAAAHTKSVQEFDLLARIGRDDLPGALRATPVSSSGDLTVPPELTMNVVDPSGTNPLLKFSLAGAQLKFSVLAVNKGLTVPARGQAGNVILKFPDSRSGFSGVPEAELGCLELARVAGIPTPAAQLWPPSEVAGLERWASRSSGMALAVHRFDRLSATQRVHMEELAQVMNLPTKPDGVKYQRANFETVALHVSALSGVDTVADVIDRIVLNIVVGNGDAHLKNWAFLYPDSRVPVLSPVYDVLPTVLYIPDDDLGLKLDGDRRFATASVNSFGRLGERSGYGESQAKQRAKEAVERIVGNWRVLKEYLTREQYDALTKRRSRLALVA